MRRMRYLLAFALSSGVFAAHAQGLVTDPAIACDSCAEWNKPHEPFKVYGNTYYVGTSGLSSVLIKTTAGLILLDGALPQSAPLIEENIAKLGFRLADVKLIASSHAHFDHAGGIAALQRGSRAEVVASAEGVLALMQGEPVSEDPQYTSGASLHKFPPVKLLRMVRDGEVVKVGDVSIKAHRVPGHTPGSTTWTWRSCEDGRCLNMVYADSLSAVSAPGFRFSGDATHPSLIKSFRRSIAITRGLACDVLLTVHPDFAGLEQKYQSLKAGYSRNPFIDDQACKAYAKAAEEALEKRIVEEGGVPSAREPSTNPLKRFIFMTGRDSPQ